MKAVIMAGGRGTRIAALAGDLPKPMLPIDGRPVLERELGSLREQGVTDVLITVGHLAPAIMEYFGDGSGCSPQTGRPFGVHIEYFVEKEPLGNAGALFRIRDRLDEDFLLLNGDVMFDVDLQRFAAFHKVHGGLATLFTHPNGHPYDSGLIVADSEQRVTQWLTKEDARPQYYRNRVNAGLHILSPKLLEGDIPAGKVDLDRQILKPLAGTGQLLCYDSPEYVKDMGTPERYAAVCEDVRSGHAAARNLRRKQKAVFLDRDGTINRYVGFLRNIDEFELLPGVAQAVRKINELGWLAVVVTNQPVIARGEGRAAGSHPLQDGDPAWPGGCVAGCYLLLPPPPGQGISRRKAGAENPLLLPQARAGDAAGCSTAVQHRLEPLLDGRRREK